jgi:hypothetical protein
MQYGTRLLVFLDRWSWVRYVIAYYALLCLSNLKGTKSAKNSYTPKGHPPGIESPLGRGRWSGTLYLSSAIIDRHTPYLPSDSLASPRRKLLPLLHLRLGTRSFRQLVFTHQITSVQNSTYRLLPTLHPLSRTQSQVHLCPLSRYQLDIKPAVARPKSPSPPVSESCQVSLVLFPPLWTIVSSASRLFLSLHDGVS